MFTRQYLIRLPVRVVSAVAFVGLVVVAGSLAAINLILDLQAGYELVVTKDAPARLALAETKTFVRGLTQHAQELVNVHDADQIREIESAIEDDARLYRFFLDDVSKTGAMDLAELADLGSRFEKVRDLLRERQASSEKDFATTLALRFEPARDDLENRLTRASNRLGAQATDRIGNAKRDLDSALRLMAIALVCGFSGLFTLAGWWAHRRLSLPIRQIAQASLSLGVGPERHIPGLTRRDEIGDLARGVATARENLLEIKKLQKENEDHEAELGEARARLMKEVAGHFEQDVIAIAQTVSAAAEELQQNASNMTGIALGTNVEAVTVQAASSDTFDAVQSLAAELAGMGASVDLMEAQVREATLAGERASAGAATARQQAGQLRQAVQHIGMVADFIAGVAAQTNLLALNATIEAARSGETGRGFAVVATEVKNLAVQIGQSAAEISAQIRSVEDATKLVVDEVNVTSDRIQSMANHAALFKETVEWRRRSAAGILNLMHRTQTGSQELHQSMARVSRSTAETGAVAQEITEAAEFLADKSERLVSRVHAFVAHVLTP